MESWKKGRGELLDEFINICNRIGKDISAELNDQNVVTIGKEELGLLRENSARVVQLGEYNERLVNALEKARESAKRVEGLEKENQRLAAELQNKLDQQQQQKSKEPVSSSKSHTANDGKNTARPSIPPSSTIEIEYNDSTVVTRETYRELVVKHNKYFLGYKAAKEAKEERERQLNEERRKSRDWKNYAGSIEKSLAEMTEKVKKLKARVQELESLQTNSNLSTAAMEEDEPSIPLLEGGIHQSVESRSTVEVPASPVTSSRRSEAMDNIIPRFTNAAGDNKSPREPRPEPEPEPQDEETCDLPPHLDEDINEVQDTEYEDIEEHQPSSTQDASDPLSPARFPDEEQAAEENLPNNPLSSPESPVIIDERPVKKRKRHNDSAEPKSVVRVKVEEFPSSPIGLKALRYIHSNESLDLDNIGEKVETPKKPRNRQLIRQPSSLVDSFSYLSHRDDTRSQSQNDITDSLPTKKTPQTKPAPRKLSALQPRSVNQRILPRTSEESPPKKRRTTINQNVGNLMEDGELAAREKSAKESSELNAQARLSALLSNPSPLKRVLSPANLGQQHTPRSRPAKSPSTSALTRGVNLDQNRPDFSSSTRDPVEVSRLSIGLTLKDVPRSSDSSRPSSKGALRSSIESSRPSSKGSSRSSLEPSIREPMGKRVEISKSKRTAHDKLIHTSPIRKETPKASTHYPRPQSRGSATTSKPSPARMSRNAAYDPKKRKSRSEITATEWEMDPEQEPLRCRPVKTLTLRDFKVNPAHQGKTYAYSEVVRGANARACLQGCTKPECCGKQFRALAEMSRYPGKPRTAEDEEKDQELLEEFLGDNVYQIRSMNLDEKEEMILQALTRQLANKHGRHRQAYERRASPPGFWDPDFPTTQEHLKAGEIAKERERDLIFQRYQEAMRPGGAYIFRDE